MFLTFICLKQKLETELVTDFMITQYIFTQYF